MTDDTTMQVHFNLYGTLTVPVGTTLTEDERYAVLPNGKHLKVWDVWEGVSAPDADDHHDLSEAELNAMGCASHIDGVQYDLDPEPPRMSVPK